MYIIQQFSITRVPAFLLAQVSQRALSTIPIPVSSKLNFLHKSPMSQLFFYNVLFYQYIILYHICRYLFKILGAGVVEQW